MTAVADDFNRANSSNLGASWTEVVGDWEIVSNRCQNNTDDGATGYYLRYETDVGSSDMFAQAVTTSTQADGGSNTGLAVRMRSAANTSYQMTTRHAGDTIGVWRIVAGAESQQNWQTEANAIAVTINSGDTIRVEAVGSLIRGKVSGALIGICVDTNITDGQRAGLNGYNAVGTDVVEVDDFAGGALAADGGLLAPYIVGISAQVTGTGTTLTPTVPANVATGDLVVAHCTSRDAAQTMTAPGSQGWDAGPTPSQTGLEDAVFYKVWGAGATDDTTPTFSIGSGTAGWGVTVTVFRNPSHSTAPWTSTSTAVVASGSAANASSATVTAPSVNHDGTHRTVVRVFSSADDNALNAPSSGALAYGGAAYDQTTGNDYAQAMSLREDITVTTNTGTSTVTETAVGNDINNGITLVLAIPSSATNASAANAAGSGAANRPTPTVAPSAGVSSGAGAAFTSTPRVAPNTGLSTATGTANQPGISGTTSSGLASGSGTAPTATPGLAPNAGTPAAAGAALAATILTGVVPQPPAAEGTGQANQPAAAVSVSAGLAVASGSAGQLTATVATGAGLALGVGAAPEATAQTGSFANAAAGLAAATAVANGASVALAPMAGPAAGAGAAGQSSGSVSALAGVGLASGVAPAAAGDVQKVALAGLAEGLGLASPTRTLVSVGAGVAIGQGSGPGADVDAGTPFIDPNPTVARVRDPGKPTLSDPSIPRLREPR